jgi:hypothetical protein
MKYRIIQTEWNGTRDPPRKLHARIVRNTSPHQAEEPITQRISHEPLKALISSTNKT